MLTDAGFYSDDFQASRIRYLEKDLINLRAVVRQVDSKIHDLRMERLEKSADFYWRASLGVSFTLRVPA